MSSWEAWRLDHYTWGWIIWIAFFFIWEFYALMTRPGTAELTAHLRPLFTTGGYLGPIYFITLGLWFWVLIHFWVDGTFVNQR
jgi:hypothetical protein